MGDMADLMKGNMWDDLEDVEEQAALMERRWRRGKHKTREGDILKLKDMTTQHLRNTIRFFANLDTKPLQRELKRRFTH